MTKSSLNKPVDEIDSTFINLTCHIYTGRQHYRVFSTSYDSSLVMTTVCARG